MILVQGYQITTTNKGSSELTMAAFETFLCDRIVLNWFICYDFGTALPDDIMFLAES